MYRNQPCVYMIIKFIERRILITSEMTTSFLNNTSRGGLKVVIQLLVTSYFLRQEDNISKNHGRKIKRKGKLITPPRPPDVCIDT